MAAKKHPKSCAYCGLVSNHWTDDHVIPDCIGDDRPLPDQMVTVRSCFACNPYWSRYEGRFRSVPAMMASDRHSLVKPMVEGAVQRHLLKDAKFRREIMGSFRVAPRFTDRRVYAGMSPTFRLDWLSWETVVGKIVRGMVHHDLKVPLPGDYVVQSWRGNGFWEDVNARRVIDQMSDQWSGMGAAGDGPDDVFLGKRAYSVDEPFRRVFLLVFFRSVAVFAWAAPASEAGLPDPSHPDQVALAIADGRRRKEARQAGRKGK